MAHDQHDIIITILDEDGATPLAFLEGYSNLKWTNRHWLPSDLELLIAKGQPGASHVKRGRFFGVYDPYAGREVVYSVDQIETRAEESTVLDLRGRSISAMFFERIVVPPAGQTHDIQENVSVETAQKYFVNQHAGPGAVVERQIPGLTVAPDQVRGVPVYMYGRFQYLGEMLKELGEATGIGYDVFTDNGNHSFETMPGEDRTTEVFLDMEFDTVLTQRWLTTVIGRKTYALVAGQGAGLDRTTLARWLGASEPTGFKRRELFVDARDVDNVAGLETRGNSKLFEAFSEDSFEVDMNQFGSFRYGRDFKLGDIVTVSNQEWGLEAQKRVIEVEATVKDTPQPELKVTLGAPYPTLQERLKQAANTATGTART